MYSFWRGMESQTVFLRPLFLPFQLLPFVPTEGANRENFCPNSKKHHLAIYSFRKHLELDLSPHQRLGKRFGGRQEAAVFIWMEDLLSQVKWPIFKLFPLRWQCSRRHLPTKSICNELAAHAQGENRGEATRWKLLKPQDTRILISTVAVSSLQTTRERAKKWHEGVLTFVKSLLTNQSTLGNTNNLSMFDIHQPLWPCTLLSLCELLQNQRPINRIDSSKYWIEAGQGKLKIQSYFFFSSFIFFIFFLFFILIQLFFKKNVKKPQCALRTIHSGNWHPQVLKLLWFVTPI